MDVKEKLEYTYKIYTLTIYMYTYIKKKRDAEEIKPIQDVAEICLH